MSLTVISKTFPESRCWVTWFFFFRLSGCGFFCSRHIASSALTVLQKYTFISIQVITYQKSNLLFGHLNDDRMHKLLSMTYITILYKVTYQWGCRLVPLHVTFCSTLTQSPPFTCQVTCGPREVHLIPSCYILD